MSLTWPEEKLFWSTPKLLEMVASLSDIMGTLKSFRSGWLSSQEKRVWLVSMEIPIT